MKIVIDIPDTDYQVTLTKIMLACYGCEVTELPKGHGRVIDYGYVVDAIDDWVNAEEYRYTNATDYLRKRVENVPTIIEAESEDNV